MIVAAFNSTARLIWTRNRKLLLICGGIYLALFLCSRTLTPEQLRPYAPPALSFLRLASFFLPLMLFVSTAPANALDVGGRLGRFPRMFFTLPVKAHEMVLPFIVFAVGTTALLWLLGTLISNQAILMFGPPGTPRAAEKIAYWVPCLATSLLVWVQALVWTPFRQRWLRTAVLLAVLAAHTIAVFLYAVSIVTQAQMIAASLLQIPFAFAVATRGVARDRSGSAADVAMETPARPLALRSFSSGISAQTWFEGRVHAWQGLVVFVPAALPFLAFTGFDAMDHAHAARFTAVARMSVISFAWLLIAAAATVGLTFASFRKQAHLHGKNAFAMPAFFATLPLSTGDFVWAKITTVATRVLWSSVAVLLACGWVAVRANLIDFSAGPLLALRETRGDFTTAMALLLPAVALVLFLIAAAANLMSLSLDGHVWSRINIINGSRYLLMGAAAATVSRYWTQHHLPPPGLADAIHLLAVMKVAALALLLYHVHKRGLLGSRRLATIVAFWLATVGSMLATAIWLVPEGRLWLPTALAVLVLVTPVLGTASSPLALQLNRTR